MPTNKIPNNPIPIGDMKPVIDLSKMKSANKAAFLKDTKPDTSQDTKTEDGFVVYEKDGMNLLKLKDQCVNILRESGDSIEEMEAAPIYLPTFAEKGTKYNKIRLIPEEKDSPFGVIQRNNEHADQFDTASCGQFKAVEVLAWLFERTGGEIA